MSKHKLQPFSNDVMHQLLLDMAQQRNTKTLFNVVVSRLAELPHIALARIWVLKPGDLCHSCATRQECSDRRQCLHLVASAGISLITDKRWSNLTGEYSRFPVGSRKVGHIAATGKPVIVEQIDSSSQWILNNKWAAQENINGFAGQPLVFQGDVLGVLAVFTHLSLNPTILSTLRVIADHVATALTNAKAFEEIEMLKQKVEQENSYLREELLDITSLGGLVGNSFALRQVLQQVDVVAPSSASVLILGESGTGKELIAREIHMRSDRKNKPMIKVNCASIPQELFESEFFGHTKGAFTGAINERIGRFEAADGGTLFLDELAEIPLQHQSKLLRVLQEGEYERVGENHTQKTNVRIIAATNKDLQEEVLAKNFREDLYFRLNVFPIKVPSLRERKEDIELLANHFLQKSLLKMNLAQQQFSHDQLHELRDYDWPGNVRELHNVVERSAIFALSGPLRLHLPERIHEKSPPHFNQNHSTITENTINKVLSEKEMLEFQLQNTKAALKQCHGKIYGNNGAAQLLGIKPTTLATRIKKMNLTIDD